MQRDTHWIVTSQAFVTVLFSLSVRFKLRRENKANMWGFLWTFLMFCLFLKPTEGGHEHQEKDHSVDTSRRHDHKVSSLQSDIQRRQKQLANTLQHFLDEYKDLYQMLEHLKDKTLGHHYRDKIRHQRKQDSHELPTNDRHKSHDSNKHVNHRVNHPSPTTTPDSDEYHDKRKLHKLRRNTNSHRDDNEHGKRAIYHSIVLEDKHDLDHDMHSRITENNKKRSSNKFILHSGNSDDEDGVEEVIGHSGEGEHSGDHEGFEGEHLNHGIVENDRNTKEPGEMHEIEEMEREEHTKHGSGEHEHMKKEEHTKHSDGENHGEKEVHESDNQHQDQKEKELQRRHIGNKNHSNEHDQGLEHSGEEIEMERDFVHEQQHDTDRDIYFNHHKGFDESGIINERHHMDSSHYDDDDDFQVNGLAHSSNHEIKRHHSDTREGDDMHHDNNGHVGPSKNRRNTQHMDNQNDDMHRDSNSHVDASRHKRKMDHMDDDGGDDDDDMHHFKNGHVDASEHERKRHIRDNGNYDNAHHDKSNHLQSSFHNKKTHHVRKNEDTHGHTDSHEQAMGPRNDDNDDSHHVSRDDHHRQEDTRNKQHRNNRKRYQSTHQEMLQQPQQQHTNKQKEIPHTSYNHRTRREKASSDDDIVIDESKKATDENKVSYPVILSNDYENHDDGAGTLDNERYGDVERKIEGATRRIRGRRDIPLDMEFEKNHIKHTSQSEPDCGSVKGKAFFYDKDNCRLCQCLKGKLRCEAKPKTCRNDKIDNMCSFVNGDFLIESTAHYDGCNHCVCRKRQWVCTRLRCQFARYDYVNYDSLADHVTGKERHVDTCMECDREPVTPVCGPDWRTYRSLCHARFCGDYDIDEIEQGPCSSISPCQHAKCTANEECVPFPRGPCLSTKTRVGHRVECKQYKCVSMKEECSDYTLPGEVVCGEDGQTYSSECHLVKKSIQFAYRGPCRASCMSGNTQVCGTDGVTFQSYCHANLLSRHVDYPGACENMVAKPEVISKNDSFVYVNRRCSKVQEMKRCLHPSCGSTVIPEGSCCPVCGVAVSIRIDRAIASDLVDFTILKPFMEFTSLETIQSFVRRIQDPQNLRKCRLTVDFTDRNDLSVLFAPRQPDNILFCQKAAQGTIEYVNSHSNSSDPIEAMMSSAVAVEPALTHGKATRVKRNVNLDLVRIRRGIHHDHESTNSNSSSVTVTPSLPFTINIFVYFSTYWVVDPF